ncbi:MAG TPA: hypothetical protein VG755_19770 [Nannocystaceae bacterium]|nr:hypothetical protein [Nannocystaceae bacterium]
MVDAEELVAVTRFGARLQRQHAAWLWTRLRANVPDALAVVLMPDRAHMIAPAGRRPQLVRVLAAFTGVFRISFDVWPAARAERLAIATKMIGDAFDRPVREGLCTDPWAWRWSTLRDLGGAADPIWTSASRIADALGVAPSRLVATLTRFAPPQRVPNLLATFAGLRAGVAAALRIDRDEVDRSSRSRRLVAQAAAAIEMPNVRRLAVELGWSERTLFRDRAARDDALDAVLLCLSDARLYGDPIPADATHPIAVGRRGWQGSGRA